MKKYGPLLMLLCCLLPVVLILAVPALGLSADGSRVFTFAVMLLCPLMMLMGHDHGGNDGDQGKDQKKHGCH
jgi:hypothetical protein